MHSSTACRILDVGKPIVCVTMRESVMPKSTKKKPRSKAVAAALKAMENMVFESADLDVQLKQVSGRLEAAGITGNLAP